MIIIINIDVLTLSKVRDISLPECWFLVQSEESSKLNLCHLKTIHSTPVVKYTVTINQDLSSRLVMVIAGFW